MLESLIMTMTIEIAPEIGKLLRTEAERKGLSPDQFVELVLEEKPSTRKISKEILREMLADGMISRIPEGITDEEDNFEPLEFNGKPVSETLLEERR